MNAQYRLVAICIRYCILLCVTATKETNQNNIQRACALAQTLTNPHLTSIGQYLH